jgi:ankyrin repeat protein
MTAVQQWLRVRRDKDCASSLLLHSTSTAHARGLASKCNPTLCNTSSQASHHPCFWAEESWQDCAKSLIHIQQRKELHSSSSALADAIVAQDLRAIRQAVEAGCSVTGTVLQTAVAAGCPAVVELLLAVLLQQPQHAKVTQLRYGSMLCLAAIKGYSQVVAVVLDHLRSCRHIDVSNVLSSAIKDGSTALHCASACVPHYAVQQRGIMRQLISAGASVRAVDKLGRTPLHIAVRR